MTLAVFATLCVAALVSADKHAGTDRAGAPRRSVAAAARICDPETPALRFDAIRPLASSVELGLAWDYGRLFGVDAVDVFARTSLSTGSWSVVGSALPAAGTAGATVTVPRSALPGGGADAAFFRVSAGEDADLDGLADAAEARAGTDPLDRDYDRDGLVDGSDPDPVHPTSLADADGDGIPDAYETHWFGGTSAVGAADLAASDGTGFTLAAKIRAGIDPTRAPAPPWVRVPGEYVVWKLFDAFAADWPAGGSDLVFSRTFPIGRTSRWTQCFLSSSPTGPGAWALEGMTLDFGAVGTACGINPVSAPDRDDDGYQVDFGGLAPVPDLPVRLRATAAFVRSRTPLYLIVYVPRLEVEGAGSAVLADGSRVSACAAAPDSPVRVRVDSSLRPLRSGPNNDEAWAFADAFRDAGGSSLDLVGTMYYGGTVSFPHPGVWTPPRVPNPDGSDAGPAFVLLAPSLAFAGDHAVGRTALAYDPDAYGVSMPPPGMLPGHYAEVSPYPLDSDCLAEAWRRDATGAGGCGCEPVFATGLGADAPAWLETSVQAAEGGTVATGTVFANGKALWTGTARHVRGGGADPLWQTDPFADGCGSCGGCADGNCDALEGPELGPGGSLRFRIPLGVPRKGQVSGFAHFTLERPGTVDRDLLQVSARGDAQVAEDTLYVGMDLCRRIVCSDPRGRTLTVRTTADGFEAVVHTTDGLTATGRLEHTWTVERTGMRDGAELRVRKVSRRGNAMLDETYSCDTDRADPVGWSRADNIARVSETVVRTGSYDGGAREVTEVRTVAAGGVQRETTTVLRRIGERGGAVARPVRRTEFDGWETRERRADYWDDPASARHGRLRLLRGTCVPWEYHDYDALGRETLRIEQRNGSACPDSFNVPAASDAFQTEYGYEPLPGDGAHAGDLAKPRLETRSAVGAEGEVLIGRTWRRYTRVSAGGVPAVKRETWRVSSQDAAWDDPGNACSYEIVFDPDAPGVPLVARGETAESLDEDGVRTTVALSLGEGTVVFTERRFFGENAFPTYTVRTLDALRGTVLRRETRLTDGDIVIDSEESLYDEKDRLRSTAYLDGTSTTNDYSCCRLLSSTDREGRRTLRSAETGTDHLYHATEDVWLEEVEEGRRLLLDERGSNTNGFKVTQHFFDAFGRETNTVVGISHVPGSSTSPTSTLHSSFSILHSSFPAGGSGCSVRTDARGVETMREAVSFEYAEVACEVVRTNGVIVLWTEQRESRNGESERTMTFSDWSWTTERRFDAYLADGRRAAHVVTESSDCGTVTNSVSTYDLLGRLVSTSVPGANGSTVVTANAYDGATSRILSAATTGSPVVTYGYDSRGEHISTSQDGRLILNETSYETVSQQICRVTTTTRMTGSVTNSVLVRKVQLTGLSDSLRSRVVSVAASGREMVTETTFDADTGVLTAVSQVGVETPVTTRSICGVTLDRTSIDGSSGMSYDALGRNVAVAVSDASGATNRIDRLEYDQSGNVVCHVTDFLDGRIAEATAEYDMLNREVRRTDALGHETVTGYDAHGRTVSTGGDAYPLISSFDSAGRKTHGFTTRDNGATWDETQWEFDPASGLNTAKQYADGSRIAYSYADNGRKTRTTWARGAWKENAYNARNLVSATTYSGAATPSVAYTYAPSGKTATATLSDGTSYAYGYDDHLLNTNESLTLGGESFSVNRTYDEFLRARETAVVVTNVRHAAKVRLYDSEDRVCGYALTNAAGRGVSVSLAYDGSHLTNTVYTLPNGGLFSARLSREAGRRNLVTRRDYSFGGQSVYWYSTDYDLLNRPTNATDSVSLVREWLYNRRSELAAATVGADRYGYDYDTIGNRLWASVNAVTNSYAANRLNQYTAILHSPFSILHSYDADGNMTGDGTFVYAYDAENRLVSATSASETNGAVRVLNFYDHRSRRIRKVVQRLSTSLAPPSPSVGTHEWETLETHMFVWDGNNIVLEKIDFADGTIRTCEYFWGSDKSGTEQGAGGVEGLLAVSIDGSFYIPCYDHNGNIVLYVSDSGSVAAQYIYDPYGKVIEQYGSNPCLFAFGFSTKYHDRETGMVAYQRRFYRPDLGRWLNRDPIEEDGGENLYVFCQNSPLLYCDVNGCWAFIDNAIAAIAGAAVGIACQGISDLIRWESSGWESYVGAAVAGAITGEILLHNPAMAGATKVMYAGMAAAVGNGVKQLCEVSVSKKTKEFNPQELAVNFAAGAVFSAIPFGKYSGVNKGRGSYLAIARIADKKFVNGSISHVSAITTLKSLAGTGVEYGVPYGAVQPFAADGINWGVDHLEDALEPADARLQLYYHEEMVIRVVDKCGNVAILHYVREIQINE